MNARGVFNYNRAMLDVLRNTLMITGFVFVMMLVIEFLNVLTSGVWQRRLAGSRLGQYVLAAALGAIPGCLGAFAVVAMYSHRVLTFGAVVAAMIATSGDEAFVMLAMVPGQGLVIMAVLFAAGILAGMASDLYLRKTGRGDNFFCGKMVVHDEHAGRYFEKGQLAAQWKRCTAARGTLTLMLALLIAGIVSGQVGHGGHGIEPAHRHSAERAEADGAHEGEPGHVHEEAGAGEAESVHEGEPAHSDEGWGWVRITMLVTSLAALFIVATVSDHFLEEHLWDHIALRHLPRVFLWTLGVLLVLYLLTDLLDLDLKSFTQDRRWFLLALACLVGLIPQSGPHLVFVTLYASGIIPFSILLANSAVQDGHGMLPLLADSRKGFIMIKAVNLLAGLALGASAFAAGF